MCGSSREHEFRLVRDVDWGLLPLEKFAVRIGQYSADPSDCLPHRSPTIYYSRLSRGVLICPFKSTRPGTESRQDVR